MYRIPKTCAKAIFRLGFEGVVKFLATAGNRDVGGRA